MVFTGGVVLDRYYPTVLFPVDEESIGSIILADPPSRWPARQGLTSFASQRGVWSWESQRLGLRALLSGRSGSSNQLLRSHSRERPPGSAPDQPWPRVVVDQRTPVRRLNLAMCPVQDPQDLYSEAGTAPRNSRGERTESQAFGGCADLECEARPPASKPSRHASRARDLTRVSHGVNPARSPCSGVRAPGIPRELDNRSSGGRR